MFFKCYVSTLSYGIFSKNCACCFTEALRIEKVYKNNKTGTLYQELLIFDQLNLNSIYYCCYLKKNLYSKINTNIIFTQITTISEI